MEVSVFGMQVTHRDAQKKAQCKKIDWIKKIESSRFLYDTHWRDAYIFSQTINSFNYPINSL